MTAKLRQLRERTGLNRRQLSDLIHKEKSYISTLERRGCKPPHRIAERIARVLSERGIPVSDIADWFESVGIIPIALHRMLLQELKNLPPAVRDLTLTMLTRPDSQCILPLLRREVHRSQERLRGVRPAAAEVA